MDYLPELIAAAGVGMVGWYLNRVTNQLDKIHTDLRGFSERLVRLETTAEFEA